MFNTKQAIHTLSSCLGACGLGLRHEFLNELLDIEPQPVDFLEIAPENWLGMGGRRSKQLYPYSERYPMVCHGLSRSIGAVTPVDVAFVKRLKSFFQTHQIKLYSEHLSYCSDSQGQLYDLMPIPFTADAVDYVVSRIRQVQDILEQPIALENVSYYLTPPGELTEIEFINAILEQADCLLLLDVNNIYVNSVNHGYDPQQFLQQIPKDRVAYIHVAGHWQKESDLIIDTHGDAVTQAVWQLLQQAYGLFGLIPTLLERDNEVPALNELLLETEYIKNIQAKYLCDQNHAA